MVKLKGLTEAQALAIKSMARRQLNGWPESRFEMTSRSTWADHPACGGTNKLYINRTTAISLTDLGLAVMNESEDRVWVSPGAMDLVRIGDNIRRTHTL